jgi:hypothetical protein
MVGRRTLAWLCSGELARPGFALHRPNIGECCRVGYEQAALAWLRKRAHCTNGHASRSLLEHELHHIAGFGVTNEEI